VSVPGTAPGSGLRPLVRRLLPRRLLRLFVRDNGAAEFAESSWSAVGALTTPFFLVALARRRPPAGAG
jgi:hypothetical protein